VATVPICGYLQFFAAFQKSICGFLHSQFAGYCTCPICGSSHLNLRIFFISSTRNKEHKPFFFENSQGDITDENGNEAMDWEEQTDPFNLENLTNRKKIQASPDNTLLGSFYFTTSGTLTLRVY
jgi:hypothetical protein